MILSRKGGEMTNRYRFIVVLFLMGVVWTNAQELEGLWLTANGESVVQIYKANNGLYHGQSLWTADQSDEAKKYYGSMILMDFARIDATAFKGRANDPEKRNRIGPAGIYRNPAVWQDGILDAGLK